MSRAARDMVAHYNPRGFSSRRALDAAGLTKAYPIPIGALAGLLTGSAASWLLSSPTLGTDIWTVTLVLGGVPLVLSTIRGVFHRRLAADLIAMLAILAAIFFDEAFAGTVIVLMQSGGQALEDYGMSRASSALTELAARAPRSANLKSDGSVRVIEVQEVRPGDALLVKRGELIPVDGLLVSQGAEIDESSVTGEPLARTKSHGDHLLSGTVNVGGAFEMKASKVSAESEYSEIVETVRRAQESKPRIQRLADRYAVWFTPLTLVVAALGVLVTANPRTLLSVLVVATPCPLILATPIAVISGVNKAASEGVIVKSGSALEQVSNAKVVVFDKTGTLTYGEPGVDRIIPLGRWTEDEILHMSASLEQLSSHPIADSITKAGHEKFGDLPVPEEFREVPSEGVEGVVNGRNVVVGLRRLCDKSAVAPFPPDLESTMEGLALRGMLATLVTVDGLPAGLVVFTDRMRTGIPDVLGRLRGLGVNEVVMLTGDNRENAEAVARLGGVTRFSSGLMPQGKVEEVSRLKLAHGVTVMVGDGINDAPALATASVGIAMGAKGTAISAEAADIVLLVDDVTKIPDVIATGRKMDRVARQGINFGLGASLILMAIAVFGVINPALGATLQEVIDVSVILNALRVR